MKGLSPIAVNNYQTPKEFRLKFGKSILEHIERFSITEKFVFGLLTIIAIISVILMIISISNFFMIEIPAQGGELREGVIGLPHAINPVLAIADADRDISSLVYSGLTRYVDGKIKPDLAESFVISEDGLKYTFTLKSNIFFHDGTPITSADIAYTIQKIQSLPLKSPRRADWNNVIVNIVSPLEIEFILKQPYRPFITNTTVGIIPKHIWNNLNDEQFIFSPHNVNPIGSGPYKIETIVKDEEGIPKEYILSSFEKYQSGKPYLDKIRIIFFADSEQAISALNSDQIDSLAMIPADQVGNIANQDQRSIITTPLPRIFGIFFNQNENLILADRNVRQALDLAINREDIIDRALQGYGVPVHGPIPPSMDFNRSEKQSDLKLAESILQKSGWTKNQATGIYEKKSGKNSIQILSLDLVTSDAWDLKQTAELIKSAWQSIGVKVEIRIFEPSDLYQNIIRPRKYDALLFGQLIGKEKDLFAFWHSSQRNAPGLNVAMYTNAKTDNILEEIRSNGEENEVNTKFAELDKIITADIPAIFLYSPNFIYILPKDLRGVRIDDITIASDRWNTVNDWYLKKEKVWKIFAYKNKI